MDFNVSAENEEWSTNIDLELKQKIADVSIQPAELQVKMDDAIGRGNFGVIYLGQLYRDDKFTTVAVKTLRGNYLLCIKFFSRASTY